MEVKVQLEFKLRESRRYFSGINLYESVCRCQCEYLCRRENVMLELDICVIGYGKKCKCKISDGMTADGLS